MRLKILIGVAFGTALLLGACSGNNASGTTGGTPGPNTESNGDNGGNGGSGGTEPTTQESEELADANAKYADAQAAVAEATEAINAAETEDTPAAREKARMAIDKALEALNEAIAAADAAVKATAEDGSDASYGLALSAQTRANSYRTAQVTILDNALTSYAWYSGALVRLAIANGGVEVPRDGANTVTVTRTGRTKDTSGTDRTQIANPDAFDEDTFEDVMYSDGKLVFSGSDDEFKLHGNVAGLGSNHGLNAGDPSADDVMHSGLKLTGDGLVIRIGGTDLARGQTTVFPKGDFTDMRKDITKHTDNALGTSDPGYVAGANGWDLAITFDEPLSMSVTGGETSWMGNGDFYWRGIAPADAEEQVASTGDHYNANGFNQPAGREDLGLYEVWLSNHIGVNKGLEPAPGSALPPQPEDDTQRYLKYAAYGLFVYTADTETFTDGTSNGQMGRVQNMYFGYSAFGSDNGQQTTDINESITSAKFVGQTFAIAVKGNQFLSTGIEKIMLRGDVDLRVSIPKTTGTGELSGKLDNFEQWKDEIWQEYRSGFEVALNDGESTPGPVDIATDGTFNGVTSATVLNAGTREAPTDISGEVGYFEGSFYGPRADKDDLEAAGSWNVGFPGTPNPPEWRIFGSFGAKQLPQAAPAGN